jgi:hypothetical protein
MADAIFIKKHGSSCEMCEFFVYDEEFDAEVCDRRLDEDEMVDYLSQRTRSCPYFRFHDEYKSVQKQI